MGAEEAVVGLLAVAAVVEEVVEEVLPDEEVAEVVSVLEDAMVP